MYLPGCKVDPTGVASTIHCGKHRRAYEKHVLKLIMEVGGSDAKKSAIFNVLREVRTDLMNGTLKLNKR